MTIGGFLKKHQSESAEREHEMKINIGAGKQTWHDFFCVDAEPHPKATRPLDLIYFFEFKGEKLVKPLPLPDECATEVHNYHFIEHVYAWEAPAVIKEFHRLLKPGGKLVLECPDIIKCAWNLIRGEKDQMCMWGLYGDWGHKNPLMMHKHGYSPDSMTKLLTRSGFQSIKICNPKTHGGRVKRDMRIEAIK